MAFIENYIYFGVISLTILMTYSFKTLLDKAYEKSGLVILWIIIIGSAVFDINKLNLLWLAPLAFLVPYYISRIFKQLPINKLSYSFKYLMSFFF